MTGTMKTRHVVGLLAVVVVSLATTAGATDLYTQSNWSSLASDRAAEKVGDSLTVLIQEASQASDTTQKAAKGSAGLAGQGQLGVNGGNGQLNLSGNYAISGQNGRSGQMYAQISVVVDEVLPNGDLHVSGDQLININGKKTQIHLTGRVRRADISRSNSVLSSSLADAEIVYGRPGLNNRKPGLAGRVSSWFRH